MRQNFLFRLAILTVIVAALTGLFQFVQHTYILSNWIWPSIAYFFLLSSFTWFITHSAIKKDNKTFITRVYSSIGIRLIFSFCPIIFYVIFTGQPELVFVGAYLLLYFFYTTFEIYTIVVNLRPDSTKK